MTMVVCYNWLLWHHTSTHLMLLLAYCYHVVAVRLPYSLFRFYPCLAMLVADDPESSFICGTYTSASCEHPCRMCLQPLASIHDGIGIIRIPKTTNTVAINATIEFLNSIGKGRNTAARSSDGIGSMSSSSSSSWVPRPLVFLDEDSSDISSQDDSDDDDDLMVDRRPMDDVVDDDDDEDAEYRPVKVWKRKAKSLDTGRRKRLRRPNAAPKIVTAMKASTDMSVTVSLPVGYCLCAG